MGLRYRCDALIGLRGSHDLLILLIVVASRQDSGMRFDGLAWHPRCGVSVLLALSAGHELASADRFNTQDDSRMVRSPLRAGFSMPAPRYSTRRFRGKSLVHSHLYRGWRDLTMSNLKLGSRPKAGTIVFIIHALGGR
jgi:hypothetical protein